MKTADTLIKSIMNVEGNIRFFKSAKKHCNKCDVKFSEKNCYDIRRCEWFISDIIHLEVMEKRRDELWAEYNLKHKGEI